MKQRGLGLGVYTDLLDSFPSGEICARVQVQTAAYLRVARNERTGNEADAWNCFRTHWGAAGAGWLRLEGCEGDRRDDHHRPAVNFHDATCVPCYQP